MREGMRHMPRNPGFIWKQTFDTDSKQKCKARSSIDKKLWDPDKSSLGLFPSVIF